MLQPSDETRRDLDEVDEKKRQHPQMVKKREVMERILY